MSQSFCVFTFGYTFVHKKVCVYLCAFASASSYRSALAARVECKRKYGRDPKFERTRPQIFLNRIKYVGGNFGYPSNTLSGSRRF